MTAWIITKSGIPATRSMYDLHQGFVELNEDIKTYEIDKVHTIPISENDIVVGHIQHCRYIIKKLTGKIINDIDYPNELLPFMKRLVWRETMKDFSLRVRRDNYTPLFIKSSEQKLFTGILCRNFSDYLKISGYDDSTEVIVSEPVNFVSEYRTYIHRHQIINCLRYTGDPWYAPSEKIINDMLDALKNTNMPIAYSIDVGILSDTKETVLVECNDGYALGNYGLYPRKYAEMHRDRWYQMIMK